jgi:hypothetical protein
MNPATGEQLVTVAKQWTLAGFAAAQSTGFVASRPSLRTVGDGIPSLRAR